ncbi:unnamed protein product [Prorocentrum cordatum]|uniref:Uncharacterized protein n=1 Tax=Prorocentrum cordatum TaxID=2364126 RepID=A0ABN9S8D8_9DINO|nr:unnamed protein product [Polarella glacialis]
MRRVPACSRHWRCHAHCLHPPGRRFCARVRSRPRRDAPRACAGAAARACTAVGLCLPGWALRAAPVLQPLPRPRGAVRAAVRRRGGRTGAQGKRGRREAALRAARLSAQCLRGCARLPPTMQRPWSRRRRASAKSARFLAKKGHVQEVPPRSPRRAA